MLRAMICARFDSHDLAGRPYRSERYLASLAFAPRRASCRSAALTHRPKHGVGRFMTRLKTEADNGSDQCSLELGNRYRGRPGPSAHRSESKEHWSLPLSASVLSRVMKRPTPC